MIELIEDGLGPLPPRFIFGLNLSFSYKKIFPFRLVYWKIIRWLQLGMRGELFSALPLIDLFLLQQFVSGTMNPASFDDADKIYSVFKKSYLSL